MSRTVPGGEGSVGPFPREYGKPHVYARDVHSGAGNCVCGRAENHRLHVSGKDVYAAMAPATYTRTLGSGVGRSPTTIEPRRYSPSLSTAIRRVRRRKPRDGSKALIDGRARLETKLDPEVLEIFRGAQAESKVRHVRTPSGVRRYHAPIGTPIVGGHAVVSLPSAGGGRARAGSQNGKRPTSGLSGGRGVSGLGGRGGRPRNGFNSSGRGNGPNDPHYNSLGQRTGMTNARAAQRYQRAQFLGRRRAAIDPSTARHVDPNTARARGRSATPKPATGRGRNALTSNGRSRNGFTGRSSGRRGGMPGRGGHNFNGPNGVPGGFPGGLLGGAGLGSLLGGGKQPAAGPKPKKAKKPPKGKQPAKGKQGSAAKGKGKTGSGSGSSGKGKTSTGSGSGSSGSNTGTSTGTTSGVSKAKLTLIASHLVGLPPDQLSTALQTLPYGVLGDLLNTIKDPQFAKRINDGIPQGSKALTAGAWLVETKERHPSDGTERCAGCGVDIDDEYDVLPLSKGVDLVVCIDCADNTTESKAGGQASHPDAHMPDGEHSRMPSQLIKWWSGPGKVRWVDAAHPLTSLHDQLIAHNVPARMAWGAAANIFHRATGEWPANRPRALGGSTHGYAKSGMTALMEAKSRLV